MKIGKYDIIGRLGSGGMGVVYKAAMPLTGKVVALKVCRPADILADTMGLDGVREFFLREAVAMASIRHPNLASIIDVGEAEVEGLGEMPFFAMEYYCGNLGQIMGEDYHVERPSRALPVDDSLFYARQLAEGLRRMHFSGMIHRDVKPFNVLLTDDEQVKLIDLGLSRLRGEPEKRPKGMVVGSPYYTAPEQEADPDAADERADLYSVGVTLFRMLTGHLPEDKSGARRRASVLVPNLDHPFDTFLEQAMHPDPERRHQSAAELLAALDELAEHWERAKAATCALVEDPAQEDVVAEPVRLRSEPGKYPQKGARQALGLDELWRPAHWAPRCFEPVEAADGGVVADRAAGLVWQRSGSDYPLTRDEAHEYVAKLNEKRYAGRDGWRLPTVDELCSLMGPVGRDAQALDFCLPGVFDPAQTRLWSADAKSFTAHWFADAQRGFIWWQDATCRFYVRAVATDESVAGPVTCEA